MVGDYFLQQFRIGLIDAFSVFIGHPFSRADAFADLDEGGVAGVFGSDEVFPVDL